MEATVQEDLTGIRPEKGKILECRTELVPVMDAVYVINGKWRIPIIMALMEGNKRFGEIQKVVLRISSKVLAHELKEMELNGFIKKHTCNEGPVIIKYELTDYSWSIKPVLLTLRDFGIKHRNKIRNESRGGG